MRYAICLWLAAFAAPAAAQDAAPEEDGLGLIDRGARLLLRQLADEIGPEFNRLADELGRSLDRLPGYHAPEVLPNGDIIIRRKDPLPSLPGDEVDI